jgi:hypothetical protein
MNSEAAELIATMSVLDGRLAARFLRIAPERAPAHSIRAQISDQTSRSGAILRILNVDHRAANPR